MRLIDTLRAGLQQSRFAPWSVVAVVFVVLFVVVVQARAEPFASDDLKALPVPQALVKTPELPKALVNPFDGSPSDGALKGPKRVTQQQRADNLYKHALAQLLLGRGNDVVRSLYHLLALDADHVRARQLLAALLVEGRALDEAAIVLREGLQRSPGEAVFSMALARIEVEIGQEDSAFETLTHGLQAAADDPQYHAFYAVLLQRAHRHSDAVQHYLLALRSDPAMATWLVGIAISWQAQGQSRDAEEAFTRARDGGLLSAPVLAFVEQQLRQLR